MNIKKFQISNFKFQINRGFTLLELLVVIGIISVLLAFGAVSYSTAQKKSRDAKRKADLQALQKVLEQCYSVNTYSYPAITGTGTTAVTADCTAQSGPSITITDPTTKTFTVTGGSGTTYQVSITLEDESTFTISQQQ